MSRDYFHKKIPARRTLVQNWTVVGKTTRKNDTWNISLALICNRSSMQYQYTKICSCETTYFTIWTGDLGEDAHYWADKMEEPHLLFLLLFEKYYDRCCCCCYLLLAGMIIWPYADRSSSVRVELQRIMILPPKKGSLFVNSCLSFWPTCSLLLF